VVRLLAAFWEGSLPVDQTPRPCEYRKSRKVSKVLLEVSSKGDQGLANVQDFEGEVMQDCMALCKLLL
jgi:hypothetical protein